jgi:hypothetical protein
MKSNPKGKGALKCAICGKPLRKHEKIGPCPELKLLADERMTVRKPLSGGNKPKP